MGEDGHGEGVGSWTWSEEEVVYFSGPWSRIEDHHHPQQNRFIWLKDWGSYAIKVGLVYHKVGSVRHVLCESLFLLQKGKEGDCHTNPSYYGIYQDHILLSFWWVGLVESVFQGAIWDNKLASLHACG